MHPHAGFPEYDQLLALLDTGSHVLDTRVVCETMVQGRRFGVHAATLGSRDPGAPAIGIFGGIHGLERIGTQLVLDYLRSVLSRLAWDELLHRELQSVRLVFMPIVNPGGMWAGTRANPNGVDLMRKGPQDADARVPFLAGGQRIGAWLPWYRGPAGAPMEAESRALLRVVQEELLPAQLCRGLPFRLRLARQHLVSVRGHAPADGAPARDVPAQDAVRAGPPAPRLHLRAAKPPVPAARRPVGPCL
jgi:hypothetical protein